MRKADCSIPCACVAAAGHAPGLKQAEPEAAVPKKTEHACSTGRHAVQELVMTLVHVPYTRHDQVLDKQELDNQELDREELESTPSCAEQW